METKQRRKRRFARSLAWLTAAVVLLFGLLPLWFPWVLAPVAARYGLGFADYERIGWTRFALTGIHGEWRGTRLKAQRAEGVLPATWLWRRFQDRTNGPALFTLSDGHLMIGKNPTNASAASPGSTGKVLNQVSRIGRTLQQWLPVATLTNCSVQFSSNRIMIPHAQWRAGRIKAVVEPFPTHGEIELAAQLDGDSSMDVSAVWQSYDTSLQGGFSRNTEGWHWQGELNWLTNSADLTAQFTTNSWWPANAQALCESWSIPSALLGIQGYENLIASLTANLVSNRFDLQASGLAQPSDASAQQGWPAVKFSFGADGDPDSVKLRTLNIQSPWLNAELTNTVGITRTGELLAEPAQLRISADLEKLPGAKLTGRVEGLVSVEPQGQRSPMVKFGVSANHVNVGRFDASAVLVRGEFDSPVLKLDEIRADLADGSAVIADGSFDTKTRSVVGGRWKASGDVLQKLLPGLSYAEWIASGELQGPLTNLSHSGETTFTTFKAAGLKPFDLQARWNGQHQHLESVNLDLKAGQSILSLDGKVAMDIAEQEFAATLDRLSLRRGKEDIYALQQPCAITFSSGKTNTPIRHWSLAVDAFNWQSEHRKISANADLAWPSRGNATLNLTNANAADFSDFLEANIANISISALAANFHWSNGPVHSVIVAAGSMTNDAGRFDLRATMKSDEFISIEQLTVGNGVAPTLSVTGSIPVRIMPERSEKLLVWDESQNIALTAIWKDDRSESFSVPMGTRGQLAISHPDVMFRISGTPDKPSAELTAGATTLTWQTKTNKSPIPKLEDLQLVVEMRPDNLRLKMLAAKLDGQPIKASGEWAFTEEAWRKLWSEKELPDWNQAQGHLELNSAEMAAFSSYLPNILSPEGHLSATLELKTGRRLRGVMSLTNAATRPVGTITPLRDISAFVRVDDYRAVLENFRGQIGGQPVRADGFVTVTELDGTGLDYNVNLSGTNVPLVRSPELLLRGDFDLSLRGGSDVPPLVSGTVTLRNGLFVQHASALVWSAPKRPELRPPYFSVTNEPFADWKLDLDIRGDRFLRVRIPVFSGLFSANFQLQGILRAPVLKGDIRVNAGRLIFPFGSLEINQGFASFGGNDLQGPNLQVNAAGRNASYDLRLEVKGPSDRANVVLSSTPPLASEQILLMLTAGEMPQSDFSFSRGARAGRLGTFLGTDMLSRYMGTDPGEERLTVRTGESVTKEGQLTYSVEYRLTDRWSIIGEYDEYNAFNTDLKWKVFSR